MIRLKSIVLAASFFSLATAKGQLVVPVTNVNLAYPAISGVTIQLGASSRSGLPTPFTIQGAIPTGVLWFCMDPLQTIYYSGSGLPVGSTLNYASGNPSDFDKWTPAAPGLSSARRQNLADLFTAFAPVQGNQSLGGALQIAIWEIVNEFDVNPFSLTNGQMRVAGNASLLLAAQGMLDSLDDVGIANHGNVAGLNFLIDGSYHSTLVQDLVSYTPVPEPSTYGIGAAVLLVAAVSRRAAKRKIRHA
jgi:hypothetical protein